MSEQLLQGQFALNQAPIESNRAFLRGLYDLDLDGKTFMFNTDVPLQFATEADAAMTIDQFVKNLRARMHIRLHLGVTEQRKIYYCAHGKLLDGEPDRLAVMECDYAETNVAKVLSLFRQVFGFELSERPELRLR